MTGIIIVVLALYIERLLKVTTKYYVNSTCTKMHDYVFFLLNFIYLFFVNTADNISNNWLTSWMFGNNEILQSNLVFKYSNNNGFVYSKEKKVTFRYGRVKILPVTF